MGMELGHLACLQAPLPTEQSYFTYWEVRLRKAVSQSGQTALPIQFVYPPQGSTQSYKETQKIYKIAQYS